jgi:hypothetical protein
MAKMLKSGPVVLTPALTGHHGRSGLSAAAPVEAAPGPRCGSACCRPAALAACSAAESHRSQRSATGRTARHGQNGQTGHRHANERDVEQYFWGLSMLSLRNFHYS